MENKEQQIIQGLKNIASAANEPVFSKEDYELFKRCGISEEEIKHLEKTEMLAGVIDVLPGDEAGIQRLAAALGAISNENNPEQNLANLKIIAEKDPEMLAKLMALSSITENEANAD